MGTGKSRLVAELIARRNAAGTPLRVVMTAANPASRNSPFGVVIDWYQVALAVPPGGGRAARAQVVQRLLHLMKTGGTPDERARAVATDLDRAMELRDGVGIGTIEIADLRPWRSAGLAAFRQAMSDRQPLLTVIEDIHHADGASLEVLRHTLASPSISGPELMILTTRPERPSPPPIDYAPGSASMSAGLHFVAALQAIVIVDKQNRTGAATRKRRLNVLDPERVSHPITLTLLARGVTAVADFAAARLDVRRASVCARVMR